MWMRVVHHGETLMLNSEDHEQANPSLARCAGGTAPEGLLRGEWPFKWAKSPLYSRRMQSTAPGCPHCSARDSAVKPSLSQPRAQSAAPLTHPRTMARLPKCHRVWWQRCHTPVLGLRPTHPLAVGKGSTFGRPRLDSEQGVGASAPLQVQAEMGLPQRPARG